jgi:hypothetical protein
MRSIVDERNVWLATVRPDGRPHLAPVWFVLVDGHVWVGTGAGSVKVRNLRANPRATIALEDTVEPFAAELLTEVVDPPFPPAVVEAFATKYGWDINVEVDDDLGELVLLDLTPQRPGRLR